MPDLLRILKLKFFFILISLLFFSKTFSQEVEELDIDSVITSITIQQDEYFFDSINNPPSAVKPRELPDSVYENLRKDEAYWYVNLAPPRKDPPVEEKKDYRKNWMESKALRNFILILIIAIFIAAIVWFLVSSNVRLFHSSKKILEDENATITEEDLFSINYENEIRTSVLAGNYRLAIRLWYLRTLKELTEKKLISYAHEKTNTEYLNELYETKFYTEFFRLTRNFEYAWYGKFDLSEQAYKMVEKEFADFNRHMK